MEDERQEKFPLSHTLLVVVGVAKEERRSVLTLRSCKLKGISEAIWPLIMPVWQWGIGVVGLLNKDKETLNTETCILFVSRLHELEGP